MEFDEKRSRIPYGIALLIVILLGLGSRGYPEYVPDALGNYPGDALWATAMYLFWCQILRLSPPAKLFVITVVLSWSVEFSQLYQADWIETIRSYRIGRLFLGSHYHGHDLPAYTVGAGIAWLIDYVIIRIAVRNQGVY